MVGNSSSGLYEAPSLRTDTGYRDAPTGSVAWSGVQHARTNRRDRAYDQSMLRHPPQDFPIPYGDGASRCIADALLAIKDPRQLLIKHFVEAD